MILGKDTFICRNTGGGKSLCYQMIPIISKKTALIVSPLVSLMEDQVLKMNALGLRYKEYTFSIFDSLS